MACRRARCRSTCLTSALVRSHAIAAAPPRKRNKPSPAPLSCPSADHADHLLLMSPAAGPVRTPSPIAHPATRVRKQQPCPAAAEPEPGRALVVLLSGTVRRRVWLPFLALTARVRGAAPRARYPRAASTETDPTSLGPRPMMRARIAGAGGASLCNVCKVCRGPEAAGPGSEAQHAS